MSAMIFQNEEPANEISAACPAKGGNDMSEQTSVSSVLKTLLNEHQRTIKELSDATGIPAPTLYSMQTKRTNTVNLDHLCKIAKFFHEDVSIFFVGQHYQKPIELTDQERLLLTVCRKMNHAGMSKVTEYAEDICGNRRYCS